MAEAIISALNSLGYKIERIEDFKEEEFNGTFHKVFIARDKAHTDADLVKSIAGKRLGTIETELKRAFGFNDSDIAGKKVEDIVELAGNTFKTQIDDLTAKVELAGKGKGGDAELQKKLEALNGEKEQLTTKLTALSSEFEGYKTESAGKLKQTAIGNAYVNGLAKIAWAETYTGSEIVRNGFDATLKSKYEFDADETGAIVVKDKATGKLIDHPKEKSKFAGLEDVLMMEATANKLIKANNAQARTTATTTVQTGNTGRPLHPNAVKAATK